MEGRHVITSETITDLLVVGVPERLVPLHLDGVADVDAEQQVALCLVLTHLANHTVQGQDRPPNVTLSPVMTQNWTISRDPEALRFYAPPHDCESCRAGIAAAVQALVDHPGATIAVGTITYLRTETT